MQGSLHNWRHEAPYNLQILGFFGLCLDSFCVNGIHHTQHISVFLARFCALCPEPWHLKYCCIEGLVRNSSTLKIMPVFWHINPPEISASACFGSSHLILIKGRSLPVLLDFIRSAPAWVILLKSDLFQTVILLI